MAKLSLRDLFFIVTFSAILVAWWLDHQRQEIEIERQPKEIERLKKRLAWVSV
jgi:hypothetical protein